MTKAELLTRVKTLLESLDEKRFQFNPNTTATIVCWGDPTDTLLVELFISCSTDNILVVSNNEYTRAQYERDIDPLEHFSTEEVSTIANILETQLNQA